MELTSLTLKEALEGLKNKKFSSVELIKSHIGRIKKFNKKINAFITICEEEALSQAREADTLIAKKAKNALLGIPVALKDNWVTKGIRSTAASKVLDNYIPQYDATAVVRLKAAGAIIIGKTNLDAWGHGSSGEHSDYGNTLNPWDYSRVTGGSSSGSGAAVSADMTLVGTGTDTGGSIRQPAAFCNVVGLKPTYGRVSRYGIIAMASSTDSIAHLTKTVWDNARVLSVTAGFDPMDGTAGKNEVPNYEDLLQGKISGLKIGIPKEYFGKGTDEIVADTCHKALKVLEDLGCKLVDISLPHTKYAYPVYAVIQASEVSSNLLRYDGVRYGNERKMFGDEAKRRIMMGTHSLSSGYADKYYHQSLKGRTLIIRDFMEAYKKVDVIACPVWPFLPFKFDERAIDPLKMYLSDVFTAPANVSGNPSLSVPAGFSPDKLPIGIQFMGPNYSEDLLYKVAYRYEQETKWYLKKPKLYE